MCENLCFGYSWFKYFPIMLVVLITSLKVKGCWKRATSLWKDFEQNMKMSTLQWGVGKGKVGSN